MIDDAWEAIPVTGWVWNLRKNGVEFIKDLPRFPNGAIEFEEPRRFYRYGEEEQTGGTYRVREVFESEAGALSALMAFIGRRIDRATRLKAKLERQLAELGTPVAGCR